MPFCKNCGSSVEGRFCPKCGAAQDASAPPAAQPAGQPGGQAAQPAVASTGGMTENVAGALCYIAGLITGIIFLVLAPYNQSKFVRFHAFQSIFFNIAWIAFWIVEMIVLGVIHAVLPFSMWFIASLVSALFGLLIWLGGLVLWILLMVKAYQNQQWQLPIIGALAKKQA